MILKNFLDPWSLSIKNQKIRKHYDTEYSEINYLKIIQSEIFSLVFTCIMVSINAVQDKVDVPAMICYSAILGVIAVCLLLRNRF